MSCVPILVSNYLFDLLTIHLREDIQLCQSTYQKTIMLSIGGATYTEGGFSSSAAAVAAANNVWAMFGPEQAGSTVKRPFGQAVVDGFDFDFESTTQNMPPFATQLRGLMTAATTAGGKPYYLSAAPQCPYPDLADNDMLNGGVSFDFIQVQFYNNYCGVSSFVAGASSQPSYNFDTWDDWAKTGSANRNVKVLVGIPANTGAGAGYTSGKVLQAALEYSEGFTSFGGVMMWDMSQLYKNPGFEEEVVQYLGSGGSPQPTSSTSRTSTSTLTTFTTTISSSSSRPSTSTAAPTTTPPGSGVPEWGQCGGIGYNGPTNCVSPFSCNCLSTWWCQCQVLAPVTNTASSMATVTARSTTRDTAAPSATERTVPEWGQCGGVGYAGSTTCASPYSCACNSKWWCQCQ